MKHSVWIIEYYSNLNRKGTLTYATIWMELENMKWNKPVTEGSVLCHSTYRRWLLFSRSVMSNSFRTHGLQHARLPCPSLSPGVCSNSSIESAIQPSHPLSSPSPPAFNLFPNQSLFQWVGSSHQVAKVLEFQLQHQSFQWIFKVDLLYDGLVWSPCSPRNFQGFSPTPQFESISSSVLSPLYGSTLTYIEV